MRSRNVAGLEKVYLFVFCLLLSLMRCYVTIVAAERQRHIHIGLGVSSFCSSNNTGEVLTSVQPSFYLAGERDVGKLNAALNTGVRRALEPREVLGVCFCFSRVLLELEEDDDDQASARIFYRGANFWYFDGMERENGSFC